MVGQEMESWLFLNFLNCQECQDDNPKNPCQVKKCQDYTIPIRIYKAYISKLSGQKNRLCSIWIRAGLKFDKSGIGAPPNSFKIGSGLVQE